MMHAIKRNSALFGGLIVCGLVCSMAAPYLMSPRGALGPTVLQAQSPLMAVFAVVLCVGVAMMIACGVARVINSAVGLFVLGAGLFILAGRLATVTELVFAASTSGSRSPMPLVLMETLLWAVFMLAAVLTVFRLGGSLADIQPLDEFTPPQHPIMSVEALKAAAGGAAVLVVVWFIAQSPMKGQVIAAVFLGAMIAGLVGRMLSPNVQPVLLFISPIAFGALGHLIGYLMLRHSLDQALVMGKLNPFMMPMPIDYAAGSLMGVAVGLGWARSFLHHEEHEKQGEAVTA